MDPSTLVTIVGWLAQPAAAALVYVAQQYLLQRLGLISSLPAASGVKPLLDDYLQKLTARLDEDRIAKLHGAFSTLVDAPKSVARHGLLIEALDHFHEVARIPKQGVTAGLPNTQLRCMAFLGMVACYNLLHDRSELIAEKMVEAVRADADTAKQWLGEAFVGQIITRFPPPGVICPKCGFENRAGSRFCNQDGYPLTQSPNPPIRQPSPALPPRANPYASWGTLRIDGSSKNVFGFLSANSPTLTQQGKGVRLLLCTSKQVGPPDIFSDFACHEKIK